MLKRINPNNMFASQSAFHFSHRHFINALIYPQFHDFYEVVLVTSGILHLKLGETRFTLQEGSLALIRPGDIHTKSAQNASHINLAFPNSEVEALFAYLCDPQMFATMKEQTCVSPILLSGIDRQELEEKMLAINLRGIRVAEKNILFRRILYDIIANQILPHSLSDSAQSGLPQWISGSLKKWNTDEFRQEGLEFFCQYSGYTKEHICRMFKRYLGVSPNVYLNQQRLQYAVYLLLHSSDRILDISYAAGFKSPGRFYRIFRDAYGIAPQQFRTMQTAWE